MPRWICPYCENITTVTETLVGHNSTCDGCQQISIVTDADEPKQIAGVVSAVIQRAQTAGLGSVTAAIVGLSVLGATSAVLTLPTLISENGSTVRSGIERLILIAAVGLVLYPILEGINEIHRCRRLLEESLKTRAVMRYRKLYKLERKNGQSR